MQGMEESDTRGLDLTSSYLTANRGPTTVANITNMHSLISSPKEREVSKHNRLSTDIQPNDSLRLSGQRVNVGENSKGACGPETPVRKPTNGKEKRVAFDLPKSGYVSEYTRSELRVAVYVSSDSED